MPFALVKKSAGTAAAGLALSSLYALVNTAYAQSVSVVPSSALISGDSRVELYGVLDIGVENLHNGGPPSTRLSSGISAGSRLGIRGLEDLGGGFKAFFTLESRIELDNGSSSTSSPFVSSDLPAGTFPTGTPAAVIAAATPTVIATQQSLQRLVTTVNRDNALFDRQAFVGVLTPYGAFIGGRLYTPGYEILNAYSVYGDATAGQLGQGYSTLTIRANNALAYRARFFDYLVITAMYSFGGSETLGGGRAERTTGPTNADDFYGANVRWAGPVFDVGIGYNRNNTLKASTNESVKGLETVNLGASAKLGDFRVFGQLMRRTNNNPIFEGLPTPATANQFTALQPLLSYQDADLVTGRLGRTDSLLYSVSGSYRLGNGTFTTGVAYSDDRTATNADVYHYSVGYFHGLSPRTTVYGVFAYADNRGPARLALGSAGYSGGFVTKTGEDSKVLQLGIRHTF